MKVKIRRSTTGVKRGDEFKALAALSTGGPSRSNILFVRQRILQRSLCGSLVVGIPLTKGMVGAFRVQTLADTCMLASQIRTPLARGISAQSSQ